MRSSNPVSRCCFLSEHGREGVLFSLPSPSSCVVWRPDHSSSRARQFRRRQSLSLSWDAIHGSSCLPAAFVSPSDISGVPVTSRLLTELAYQIGFSRIRGPFPVDDVVLLIHIQSVDLGTLALACCQHKGVTKDGTPKAFAAPTLVNLSRPPSVSLSVFIHFWALVKRRLRLSWNGASQGSSFTTPVTDCQPGTIVRSRHDIVRTCSIIGDPLHSGTAAIAQRVGRAFYGRCHVGVRYRTFACIRWPSVSIA